MRLIGLVTGQNASLIQLYLLSGHKFDDLYLKDTKIVDLEIIDNMIYLIDYGNIQFQTIMILAFTDQVEVVATIDSMYVEDWPIKIWEPQALYVHHELPNILFVKVLDELIVISTQHVEPVLMGKTPAIDKSFKGALTEYTFLMLYENNVIQEFSLQNYKSISLLKQYQTYNYTLYNKKGV